MGFSDSIQLILPHRFKEPGPRDLFLLSKTQAHDPSTLRAAAWCLNLPSSFPERSFRQQQALQEHPGMGDMRSAIRAMWSTA